MRRTGAQHQLATLVQAALEMWFTLAGQSCDEPDSALMGVQSDFVVCWCSVQGSCQKKEGHRWSMLRAQLLKCMPS